MSFGVVIAPLALILLFMRLTQPVEKIKSGPAWQLVVAQVMHYLLYTLLIIIPISGYAYASSMNAVVRVFGLFDLPTIFSSISPIARTLGELHPFLAWTIGTLVLGHFAAALYHHFVLKDKVLTRMLPETKRKSL
jgi:cytochrome b561